MDQKPIRWHYHNILQKKTKSYLDNFVNFSKLKLIFKCLNNHVSPLFSELAISCQSSHWANA